MKLKWKLHTFNFEPTLAQLQTVGPTQYPVMGVKRGTWVRYVAVRIGVLFDGTTPTLEVGDDDDVDGYVDAADVTIGTIGLYPGWGAADGFFRAANGKLYTEDDTIEISYTGVAEDGGLEVTQGQAIVYIVYAEIE